MDAVTEPAIHATLYVCYLLFFSDCLRGQKDDLMDGNSRTVSDGKEIEPSEGNTTMSNFTTTVPEGFMTIQQIRDMPNEKIQRNNLVNVIGVTTDFQAPIQFKGGLGKGSFKGGSSILADD